MRNFVIGCIVLFTNGGDRLQQGFQATRGRRSRTPSKAEERMGRRRKLQWTWAAG